MFSLFSYFNLRGFYKNKIKIERIFLEIVVGPNTTPQNWLVR